MRDTHVGRRYSLNRAFLHVCLSHCIARKRPCRRLGKKRKCMMTEYPCQPSLPLIAFGNVYWSANSLKSLNPANKLSPK